MKESIKGVLIETNDETCKVRISRHSECSSCGLCPGENAVILSAYNKAQAKPGQSVILEVEKTNLLKIAFFVYIMPLLAILTGAYVGFLFSNFMKISNNVPMISGGLIFFLISVFFVKRLDSHFQSKPDTHVVVKADNG